MQSQEPIDSLSIYLGYQGFRVVDVRIESDPQSSRPGRRIKVVELADTRKSHLCPDCGRRRKPIFQEVAPIRLRDCSVGDFETFVEIRPYRVRCCGGTRVERIPFKAKGHRMTVRFFQRVAALARREPIASVAEMANLSWDTVARIDKEATVFALGGPRPILRGKLRWIGIDEVSRNGGRSYFTIITNLKTGIVIWIGDGKGEPGAAPFFRDLGKKKLRQIRGVVADLGYQKTIQTWLPHATYLLDRFHVVQWVNDGLTKLRRRIFGAAPGDATGHAMKAQKWLLLTGREKLEHKHKLRLARLIKLNEPLYKAYLLKEQLRAILRHNWKYLGALRRNLEDWCEAMIETGQEELVKVAKRIKKSLERIIDRYRHLDVKMGLVEGLNSVVASIRVQARGYRDPDYFKLKIYQRLSLEVDPWKHIIL